MNSIRLNTSEVPQADDLQKVLLVLQFVADGAKTQQDMGTRLGYVERQGRYYRLAAQILGLIESEHNSATLTDMGKALIESNPADQLCILQNQIIKAPLFRRVFIFLEKNPLGSINDIANVISELTKTTESMSHRRGATVLSWLKYANFIDYDSGNYQFKGIPFGVSVVDFGNLEEPIIPQNHAFSEYEELSRRNSGAAETINVEIRSVARERAVDSHNMLTNLMAEKIRSANAVPRRNPLIDLAASINGKNYIFEIKSANLGNVRDQMRKGIAQLYEYKYLHGNKDTQLVLVMENHFEPQFGWIKDYLVRDRKILYIWDGDGAFHCTEQIVGDLAFAL